MEHYKEAIVSWSVWGVAYCVVSGVRILGTVSSTSGGRMGWRLDNEDNKAWLALDTWRNGTPSVNGRELVDAHFGLMDDIRRYL